MGCQRLIILVVSIFMLVGSAVILIAGGISFATPNPHLEYVAIGLPTLVISVLLAQAVN